MKISGQASKLRLDYGSARPMRGWCWWYRKYAPGDTVLEGLESKACEGRKGLWVDPHEVDHVQTDIPAPHRPTGERLRL